MGVFRLLASVLLFLAEVESRRTYAHREGQWHVPDLALAVCSQDEPSCADCLATRGCTWCVDEQSGAPNGGECKQGRNCLTPVAECAPIAPDKLHGKREPLPLSSVASKPREEHNVTKNASVLCAEFGRGPGGCHACASHEFCFWCQETSSCHSYFNQTIARESCPTGSWFKDQCRYPVGVIPCSERNRTCRACLADDFCYYCETKAHCEYYPEERYSPPNCPRDRVYHGECPYAGSLLLVLLPILAIILIPVFVYIFIWLICCCMRAAGYEPLGDGSDQAPPGERKHRKGIRLKPGSPSNRTDTLRKKYKLDNP